MRFFAICRSVLPFFLVFSLFVLLRPSEAQIPRLQGNPETGETQAQFAKRTQWWRDAKFGLFIHWGVYSVPNSDHKNTSGLGEWYMANNEMSVPDYEKYAAQFDPVKFNAHDWVTLAKAAGMKYLVITAKHHDGFDMFNSKLSDYNIVKATPWHHDPMKDLAAECQKQGIKLCFYYSVKDWHHPDYLPRVAGDKRGTAGADLNRYITYLKGQVRELLTNYGPVGVIWFDGHLDHSAEEEHATEVVKMMRSVQPNLLINDRINLPEDFSTPEGVVPATGLGDGRLWETCMTLNDHWGYAWPDHNVKTEPVLIQTLCDVASKGGNYLLNVGPDDQGTIPDEEAARLREVGAWMRTNGESIYGTTKSPFRSLDFDGRCTQKGSTLYLQIFHWPVSGLTVHGLVTPIREAVALHGNQRLAVKTLSDGGLSFAKPDTLDPAATVIRLSLAGLPTIDSAALRLDAHPDGTYLLTADTAGIEGDTARIETSANISDIGYWTSKNDRASWKINVPSVQAGRYKVSVECACDPQYAGSTYALSLDSGTGQSPKQTLQSPKQTLTQTVTATKNWDTFETVTLPGTLMLTAGSATIRMTAANLSSGDLINLRRIVLTPVPVSVPVLPEPKFKIMAYLPQYHVLTMNPALAANITDLIFFSVDPTPEGGIDRTRLTPPIAARLAAIKRQYHIRLILGIGGGDRSLAFPPMATDPGRRRLFVADLVQFATRHGFDGVDFDWEFPNNPAEKAGLTGLVVETKQALAPLGLTVTLAAAVGDWFDAKLIAAVDQFNLMSYYNDSHQAGLTVSQSDVDHLLKNGAAPSQICLGLPFFAENIASGSDEGAYYAQVVQKYPLKPQQDAVADYTFNGVQTVKDKTQYALDRHLGGVMIFELGQDTPDGALSGAIHKMIDPLPPLLAVQPDGTYHLTADTASLEGPAAQIETSAGISDIGYWTSLDDKAAWKITVPSAQSGTYTVAMECACDPQYAGSTYSLTVDGGTHQMLNGTVTGTKSWDDFHTVPLPGTVTLAAGVASVQMQATALPSTDLINLRRIILTPVSPVHSAP